MKSFLLITFCFGSLSFSYSQDFKSDTLFAVYGIDYYKGTNDNHSSIKLKSNINCIEISFEVIDDTLNLNDNIWISDHIELWFCMNNKPNNFVVWKDTFYSSNKEILMNKEEKLNFLNFIKTHPLKTKETIDIDSIDIVKELTGMVHFGVNPKTDSITLFDSEFYQKGSITINLNNFIDIKKEFTKNGYRLKLTLLPEAFIFFEASKISELYMMADIFDVDKNEKDLSVLSTNKNRAWAEPTVFTRVALANPITIAKKKNNKQHVNGFYKYEDKQWLYLYPIKERLLSNDAYYSFSYQRIANKKKPKSKRKEKRD